MMEWLLTYGLLLACPLVMLWCMRGMRDGGKEQVPVEQLSPGDMRKRLAKLQREELQLRGRLVSEEQGQGGSGEASGDTTLARGDGGNFAG